MPALLSYDPRKVTFSGVPLTQFDLVKTITIPNVSLVWGFDSALHVEILAKYGILRLSPNAAIFDEIRDRIKDTLSLKAPQ